MTGLRAKIKKLLCERPTIINVTLAIVVFGAVASLAAAAWVAPAAKPDAVASLAAFQQVYRVLTSPRCLNCHPAGDAPLQGDDSHVHIQNVKRGKDGHGVYGMKCDTCHQDTNLPGAHMPPGNPKWALPPPEHKMVFEGMSPAELCKQIKGNYILHSHASGNARLTDFRLFFKNLCLRCILYLTSSR